MERVEELEAEEKRLQKACTEKDVVIQTWQASHKKSAAQEEELRDKISLLEVERDEFMVRKRWMPVVFLNNFRFVRLASSRWIRKCLKFKDPCSARLKLLKDTWKS
jgi:hypothetical protein